MRQQPASCSASKPQVMPLWKVSVVLARHSATRLLPNGRDAQSQGKGMRPTREASRSAVAGLIAPQARTNRQPSPLHRSQRIPAYDPVALH
jgi:hypothetical protein